MPQIKSNHKSIPRRKTYDTKEVNGKSMMLALQLLRLAESTSRDKVTLNSAKMSLHAALSIVELCLAEGIS